MIETPSCEHCKTWHTVFYKGFPFETRFSIECYCRCHIEKCPSCGEKLPFVGVPTAS